ADALKIEPTLADQIIDGFKKPLLAGRCDTRLLGAFGSVASDSRPRGEAVFGFLQEALVGGGPTEARLAGADALSRTNLRTAADLLAEHYAEFPGCRESLVRMGDLAVAAIVKRAVAGHEEAVDDLRAIGTPEAAEGLVGLLWDDRPNLARRGAWCLAN